jgi:hypothetical protein
VNNGGDPGRDDGLPPVNIVIPDDARELDRDVLAYRREQRVQRRRDRLMFLTWPFRKLGPRGPAAVVPLIAACAAVAMLAVVMLSVVTISPAVAPTVPSSPAASASRPSISGTPASGASLLPAASPLSPVPAGTIHVGTRSVPVRDLVTSVLALIPANCSCGPSLRRLAGQASAARVAVYFVGEGAASTQIPSMLAAYGDGAAIAAYDTAGLLDHRYRPDGLTLLMVYADATAQVERGLTPDFQLGSVLDRLVLTGREATS